MSNFAFLSAEWPDLFDEAQRAERLARVDPRTSCFYARRALELTVNWLYRFDSTLNEPTRDDLHGLITEPTLVALVGSTLQRKMDVIRRIGNRAVHRREPVHPSDAVKVAAELFHVLYWVARTYTRDPAHLPADTLVFDASVIKRPATPAERVKQQAELKKLEEEHARRDAELAEERARSEALNAEVERLRAQVAEAKAANSARADRHDYNEAQTRDLFIDLMLKEAGWSLDGEHDREYPVTGMPNTSGSGRIDYVLWDDDGRPLAVVEAKRARRSPAEGQQQAKLYADALEARFNRRPVIFYTNGYDTYLWDDTLYPPRQVRGFYTKDELRLLVQRRARQALAGVAVNPDIAGRPYQKEAIRRVGAAFESGRRKALVVMATGAGKTRTTVALVDQLMRAGWVKRVLFLADRTALVTQAVNAFKTHLGDSNPVNLTTEPGADGRVYVSTYPTMMNLIDRTDDGMRRFGPGYFDLVVVDEAHRSVYQKYREIFAYFDALLLGLTATPKDEVDRNTYRLFELEAGAPTYVYSLEDAARDGYLVLPKTVAVPLRFQREGIRYDDLSEEEKAEWDALDWGEEEPPDEVDSEAVNKFLFNADTVDKALEVLMTRGHKVAGGDRLGKTIIFAKNNAHAEFIEQRFNANYPEYRGGFARVITHRSDYAQNLIDQFATPDRAPHIAISVDMLDTGIDVPEVVNLVLFKLVRSKTKFWQMIGRGTRLRRDLFGPGRDKEDFLVFDLCGNVEFFNQDLPASEGHIAPSLGERLLRQRLEVLRVLDERGAAAGEEEPEEDGTRSEAGLRRDLARHLHRTVTGMDPDSFLVRPHRRQVEFYSDYAHWRRLRPEDYDEIAAHLAGLPSGHRADDDTEEAKRFDLWALRLQLGRLTGDLAGEERIRGRVQELASALLEKTSIPGVRQQQEFLEEVAGEEWWVDVTAPMLESMRRRMRSLVRLVDRTQRTVVYTDFADELGEVSETVLRGVPVDAARDRLEGRLRRFLRGHEDLPAVRKLRSAVPVDAAELADLERSLLDADVCTAEELREAEREHGGGLGRLVRVLLGLDRDAVEAVFAAFQRERSLTAAQTRFVEMMVGSLESNGTLDVGALYESPFTALAPNGPEDLFGDADIDALVAVLERIEATAVPS